MMNTLIILAAVAASSVTAAPKQGVPAGCDPSVMSEKYWQIWNADEQAKIDADIEANRKADAVFAVDAPEGTEISVEQLDHDFRFGAHIFNFNQLGRTEYNDAYKASYGDGGLFNQATVGFYWMSYEPHPGKLRAHGGYEDSEAYWNSLSQEDAMLDANWRRPAPGPVIDFLKTKDVAIHGHILIWGYAKPYWIYDWYCPENEKRYFDGLGIPRHSSFLKRTRAGAEQDSGFGKQWINAWQRASAKATEKEIAEHAPVFTANLRRLFRKRVADVAADFGDIANSWDVVNESSVDWSNYRKSKSGLPVWFSAKYGMMPGDYPLYALLDAKELMSPSAKLAINDYNVGVDFQAQIKDLASEGARVDIVGCQMHIFDTNDCARLAKGESGHNWIDSPKMIQDRLDTMAKTGKPIHVSEITITSPGSDAKSRQIQAILTRNAYRKWFSHKSMMGITWWNTVDGGGVYGEPTVSGLFTRDMQKKPAYNALDELINREWKTKTTVKTEKGFVSFRGFRGKYRLSWKCGVCGKTHSREVWLTGDGVKETGAAPKIDDCYRAVRTYVVDGRKVELGAGEAVLDLKKIYPDAVVKGKDGERWAELVFTVKAEKDGEYCFERVNDFYGHLFVNGEDLGECKGAWNKELPAPFTVRLKSGANEIRFRTRSGSGGNWHTAFYLPRGCTGL